MNFNDRKNYLIDSHLQFSIVTRVFVYFVASILFVALTLTFWNTYVSVGGSFLGNLVSTFTLHSPVFLMSILFLPFAIYDSLKLSHRFAGPIYRLRQDLEMYKSDSKVRTRIRKTDFLQDLPDSINDLLEELESLKKQQKLNVSQKQLERV